MGNESSIIQECQKGNTEQFALLYDAYVKKIYNFFYFRTLHKETSEDLTSQTFFKALEKINTFKLNKSSFQTWLYVIARNNLIDNHRNKKLTEDILEAENIPSKENIENQTDIILKLQQIHKLLNKLNTEQKEIVIMRLWEDLQFKDIAEIADKSESACKMQFGRIIKGWKEILIALIILIISLK